jgi:hypothetical protein
MCSAQHLLVKYISTKLHQQGTRRRTKTVALVSASCIPEHMPHACMYRKQDQLDSLQSMKIIAESIKKLCPR